MRDLQHIVFMHSHHMAHLDISLHNILTDYKSHYAFIDFESCRRFDSTQNPRMRGLRATDVPPEAERGEWTDPYKADVWSLAVLIHRACKVCDLRTSYVRYHLTELLVRLPDTVFQNSWHSRALCCTMTTTVGRVLPRS